LRREVAELRRANRDPQGGKCVFRQGATVPGRSAPPCARYEQDQTPNPTDATMILVAKPLRPSCARLSRRTGHRP
jgi:hypothetical protein